MLLVLGLVLGLVLLGLVLAVGTIVLALYLSDPRDWQTNDDEDVYL